MTSRGPTLYISAYAYCMYINIRINIGPVRTSSFFFRYVYIHEREYDRAQQHAENNRKTKGGFCSQMVYFNRLFLIGDAATHSWLLFQPVMFLFLVAFYPTSKPMTDPWDERYICLHSIVVYCLWMSMVFMCIYVYLEPEKHHCFDWKRHLFWRVTSPKIEDIHRFQVNILCHRNPMAIQGFVEKERKFSPPKIPDIDGSRQRTHGETASIGGASGEAGSLVGGDVSGHIF